VIVMTAVPNGGLAPGARVRVHSLAFKPELNGKEGVVVQQNADRWMVTLSGQISVFSLKVCNLEIVKPGVSSVAATPAFRLVAASATMQGLREAQEDRHMKIPDLSKAARALKLSVDHLGQPCAFFAVFDGHCGQACSDFANKNLYLRLLKHLAVDPKEGPGAAESWSDDKVAEAIKKACDDIDAEFLKRHRTAKDGTTVVAALLAGRRCFLAWAGDSRGMLCQQSSSGGTELAFVTEDHRPTNPAEAERITQCGGEVVDVGDGAWRVARAGYEERRREITRAEQQGLGLIGKWPVAMAVSRSLGDRDFKSVTGGGQDVISGIPEVQCIHLDKSHKFLALMCDGVTDAMSNEDIAAELSQEMPSGNEEDSAKAACSALLQEALRRGSSDNVTVTLVRLEWSDRDAGSTDAEATKKRRLSDAPTT